MSNGTWSSAVPMCTRKEQFYSNKLFRIFFPKNYNYANFPIFYLQELNVQKYQKSQTDSLSIPPDSTFMGMKLEFNAIGVSN